MKNSRLSTEVKAYEKQYLRRVLRTFLSNKVETAKYLEIGLSTLYRKIKKLRIDRK